MEAAIRVEVNDATNGRDPWSWNQMTEAKR
jgi:hypothetical protein